MPPAYEGLPNRLMQMGVLIFSEPESAGAWTTVLLSWAPILQLGFP
jgi:hypothetical protein